MATPDQIRKRGRWSLVLGTLLLAAALAAVAYADQIEPDADLVLVGDQSSRNLGTVAAGATVTPGVSFELHCNGNKHVNSGQNVDLTFSLAGSTVPPGGSLSATGASIGPIPPSWPDDDSNCSSVSPAPTPIQDNGNSTVTITAPSTPGSHTFVVRWDKSISPPDVSGTGPTVSFTLTVPSDTTPPVLTPAVAGTLGDNGWYRTNVTLGWSVVDNESSITSQSGCGTVNITSDQAETTYTCTATSGGGTSSQSVSLKRDATPPTISGSRSPAPNAAGWNNTGVTVSYTCGDNLSDVASCGPNQTLASNGAGQSATGSAVDNAGNSATATLSGINIDKVAPTVTASAVKGSAPGFAGATSYAEDSWTNQDVEVTFNCSDGAGGSGVAPGSPSPASQTFTAEGTHTASSSCSDIAGNSASTSFGVKIDKTPPALSISAVLSGTSTAYSAGTWTNQDVDVSFSCTDSGGSGIDASSIHANETVNASKSYSETCKDNAGNTSAVATFEVNIDKVAPTVTASAVKGSAPGFAGATSYAEDSWTNQDVEVTFNCSDGAGGSGVAPGSPSPASQTFTAEGTHTASSSCSDIAGNSASTSFGVKIDKTPPALSISAVLSGTSTAYSAGTWTNQDVDVSFSCTDSGGSGIDASSIHANETVNASKSYSETCKDNAGNTSAVATFEVNIDKVAPTVTASAVKGSAPGFAGATSYAEDSWTNQDVEVTFNCSDGAGGSGVAPGSPSPASQTFTAEGTHTASSSCSDIAGNSASTSFGVKIDKTPPNLSAVATVDGGDAYASGEWTNKTVTVSFTCNDALSGIAGSCPADVVVSADTAIAGQNVSANVSDNAGNSAGSNVVNVKVDKTAPVVNVTGASNGATYTLGSVPVPGCSTSDLLSGVKTSATLQPLTGSGTTNPNGVGSFTATCSGAEDNAGNAGSATATYSVVYGGLARFLQPINNTAHDLGNNPDVSTFKAGSTVPVKIQIKLPNGAIVQPAFALWLTPQKGVPTGQPVDETVFTDPASSGTNYVWNGDHHQYNWKSDKTGAGFYWLIGAKLDDGQMYRVYVSLR